LIDSNEAESIDALASTARLSAATFGTSETLHDWCDGDLF